MKSGDIVKIINCHKCYDFYKSWAKDNGLTRWTTGCPQEGHKKGEWKIIVMAPHGKHDKTLYGIEEINTGKQFIMSYNGIKLLREASFLEEDLFEI
jgi:hypothetical protein